MKILVDENCLWLAKESHRSLFKAKGYDLFAVGESGCPAKKSSDQKIIAWLQENGSAILTYDYDDFYEHAAKDIVIFGMPGQGVFLSRPDIILQCIKNCVSTFGKSPPPPGLYVLSYYRWD